MKRYTIPRLGTKLLLPLILLFALYVQFHGDYGPGGGFQAGVIFGAGFILYALIYGLDHAHRLMPLWLLRIGISLGVLIYASVGLVGLLLGGNYLDYVVPKVSMPTIRSSPSRLSEWLGVGMPVWTVMVTIFYAFAGRGR